MNRRTAIRLFAATAGAAAAAVVARQAQRRARLLRTQGKNVRDEFVAKYPVERSFATVAGCRTHVYMAGPKESDRRPLLLLHGGVIEAASWMEAVTALCADRLVIAPDLPAHGASGYLPPPQLLGWLEAFVNHSGGWQWLLDLPASVLESITSPTLLVWGEKDRIVPFNGARTASFIDHLPHARVHFFPSLGHLPQVESPDEFNAVIRDFLPD